MDRPKRFTLFALPGRPVHSDTNSASPGSTLARQQLLATTKSVTFPPLSIARYSFIQLSQLRRQWRERKCPLFETVAKGGSNPGSLDCESGILPLSYRAPYTTCVLLDLCMSCTILTYCSGTPFFLKHHQMISLGILSNAFSRYTRPCVLFFL